MTPRPSARMMAPRAPWILACVLGACAAPATGADRLAERLHREGKLTEAYAAYARALCAQPERFDLARGLVETWAGLGQPGRPAAALGDCTITPAVAAYLDGLAAGAGGQFEAADRALAQAMRLAPLDARAEILTRRGLVALRAEQPERALAHLQDAAGIAPDRASIRVALARARLALGGPENAIAEVRGMLALEPDRETLANAREVVAAVVARSQPPLPEGVEATLRETLGALDQGKLERDAMLRALALAAEMSHPRVLTVAGLAALAHGIDAEGSRLLEQAARLNPLDPDPVRALGAWHFSAERMGQAVSYLRQTLARDPLDGATAAQLGTAARTLGDWETAREAYRVLVALEPRAVPYRLELARALRTLGQLTAARAAAEAAYQLDPRHIPLLLERAVIEAQLARAAPTADERREAERRTRQSVAELLEVSPDHPGARSILAGLER